MKSLLAVVLGLALLPSIARSLPASPPGPGPAASAPGYGPGPGPRGGPGSGHWGSRYTPGWSMMTPAERDQHREAMRNVRSYDECRKAFDEHRALMEKRAAERGVQMPMPRRDACAGLPQR